MQFTDSASNVPRRFENKLICFCLKLPLRFHISSSCLEQQRDFNLITEQNNVFEVRLLSTQMKLYQGISTKFLSLHSADIAQNYRWHWRYLRRKQVSERKAIFFRTNYKSIRTSKSSKQHVLFEF